jgi:hypothetical protein
MTKLCARGKAAAKRKFKVYPSAYANAYASKICAGKIKDPSGVKRKDWGPKKMQEGGDMALSPKQKKIAAKAGNPNKIESKDFAKLREEKMIKAADGQMVRGPGAAIRGTNFRGVF